MGMRADQAASVSHRLCARTLLKAKKVVKALRIATRVWADGNESASASGILA